MAKKNYRKELYKPEIADFFDAAESKLTKLKRKMEITIIGGAALVYQEYIQRSTHDIDLALARNAADFEKLFSDLGIEVNVRQVYTTVDLTGDDDTVKVYGGNSLTVYSANAEALIKMKLERFRDTDESDIIAVITIEDISYDRFKALVSEGLKDYIFNKTMYAISGAVIVERVYPDRANDFHAAFSRYLLS